jgi:hypothetical protein
MRANVDLARRLFLQEKRGGTNIADKASATSRAISEALFARLGVKPTETEKAAGQTAGVGLEDGVTSFLTADPTLSNDGRRFRVQRSRVISEFAQYEHLAEVETLVQEDGTGHLREALGGDYLILPDVVVSIPLDGGTPFLHAAVSCKWTIRSDRVQNIRHEANILLRHRHGRAPHIVAVTAEPLPSRLESIAMGTGELDCVYHLVLDELREAVAECGFRDKARELDLLVKHGRLADLSELPRRLVL